MRELMRGAAIRGRDVELELFLFLAIGEEGELLAVGRPRHGEFIVDCSSIADGNPFARGEVDGGLIGIWKRFDIGHVSAIGRDGGLKEAVGGGDFVERRIHGDDGGRSLRRDGGEEDQRMNQAVRITPRGLLHRAGETVAQGLIQKLFHFAGGDLGQAALLFAELALFLAQLALLLA